MLIPFGWLSASMGGSNFIGVLSNLVNGSVSYISSDLNGSIYLAGGNWASKLSASGDSFVYQSYSNSTVLTSSYCIDYDSNGQTLLGLNADGMRIIDSFGSLVLNGKISNTVFETIGIKFDTAGNAAFLAPKSNGHSAQFHKHSILDGSVIWQRRIATGANTDYNGPMGKDENNNAYFSFSSTGAGAQVIVKYNTSGTIQWQRGLNTNGTVWAADTSASGDTYAVQVTFAGTILYKINTSGVYQWGKLITGVQSGSSLQVRVDSLGNVYFFGKSDTAGESVIYKYDSSGNIIWTRSIKSANTPFNIQSAYIQGESIYVAMDSNFFAKLPTDGSLLGTYVIGGKTIIWGTSTTSTQSARTDSVWASGYTESVGFTGTWNPDSSSLINTSATITTSKF